MSNLYIGLMSGTSLDGIDAALVDFSQNKPTVIATHYSPYHDTLRQHIQALCQPGDNEIQRLGEMDIILGKAFADTINQLLAKQHLKPTDIKAIGSHGQTIRHVPDHAQRFTLQIGDPNTIVAETGITTIADFRRKDIAFGGQGAPLVPAFHQHLFASTNMNRAIVNIGGIANVTFLPKQTSQPIIGFDTGPGNVLLNAWIATHQSVAHDEAGQWASQGNVLPDLLKRLLSDTYFSLPPPKSTGREHFNVAWLQTHLNALNTSVAAEDVQATLTELTATSIVNTIKQFMTEGEILICGGGARNTFLMSRLTELAKPNYHVDTTEKHGIHPDWIEAVAFAWLAKQTLDRKPGNLPSVTGAAQAVVLGGVYYA